MVGLGSVRRDGNRSYLATFFASRSSSIWKSIVASKGKGLAGVPWPIAAVVTHALVDVITNASCPHCNGSVVLYVCVNCKNVVRPTRGWASS